MGTWGSGNFDSDKALDYLASVADPLVAQLQAVVDTPSLAEADEDGGTQCLVAAEILIGLKYYTSPKLTPQLVTDCRDVVLAKWEATIDELDPDEDYKTERRAIMQQTFAQLLTAVQRWQRHNSN
ncbi:DUF4259 domain-containing protein [Hymenobacter negativus]|uniref:DUF4259 domain-containing protein n=1 Tax=Hymenobacter negativus TaxID=2795026 RepID=A0ABS3QC63_9BACT|nr:DUF4259 domain-containing protein [Hymenobacter negativus]MBO2008305.1 DUF4259 domain-containing protein [Hymenobacter negativus]